MKKSSQFILNKEKNNIVKRKNSVISRKFYIFDASAKTEKNYL